MAKKPRTWIAPVAILALVTGGYVVADIADVAPGLLTTDAPWPPPEPFPTPVKPQFQPLSLPGLPPSDAPIPQAVQVQALVDRLVRALGEESTVLVRDHQTGEQLAAYQPTTALVPASTTKAATALAALAAASGQHRFTTQVRYDDAAGHLYLVGGGDLMLSAEYGDPTLVMGHAGLADLADEVAAALPEDAGQVSLLVDESFYSGPMLAPNWGQGDVWGGWAMNIRPLAVNLGQIEGQNERDPQTGLSAGKILREHLLERGIEVAEGVKSGISASGLTVVGEVESAPLEEVIAAMLIPSENIAAEVIGRLVAAQRGNEVSFAGAGAAIVSQLKQLGIDTTGMKLSDASGLSSLNRISATTLVDIVDTAASTPEYVAAITGMPVGGLEGTLSVRMRDTAAAGAVFAKTGTLNVAVSLAGLVITEDERVLSFGVIVNNAERGNVQARADIDEFVAALAACGCS